MLDLYCFEYEKGVFDQDLSIFNNTGFMEDRPFHMDVGQLSPAVEHETMEEFLKVIRKKIAFFLQKKYPAYKDILLTDLDLNIHAAICPDPSIKEKMD